MPASWSLYVESIIHVVVGRTVGFAIVCLMRICASWEESRRVASAYVVQNYDWEVETLEAERGLPRNAPRCMPERYLASGVPFRTWPMHIAYMLCALSFLGGAAESASGAFRHVQFGIGFEQKLGSTKFGPCSAQRGCFRPTSRCVPPHLSSLSGAERLRPNLGLGFDCLGLESASLGSGSVECLAGSGRNRKRGRMFGPEPRIYIAAGLEIGTPDVWAPRAHMGSISTQDCAHSADNHRCSPTVVRLQLGLAPASQKLARSGLGLTHTKRSGTWEVCCASLRAGSLERGPLSEFLPLRVGVQKLVPWARGART